MKIRNPTIFFLDFISRQRPHYYAIRLFRRIYRLSSVSEVVYYKPRIQIHIETVKSTRLT